MGRQSSTLLPSPSYFGPLISRIPLCFSPLQRKTDFSLFIQRNNISKSWRIQIALGWIISYLCLKAKQWISMYHLFSIFVNCSEFRRLPWTDCGEELLLAIERLMRLWTQHTPLKLMVPKFSA